MINKEGINIQQLTPDNDPMLLMEIPIIMKIDESLMVLGDIEFPNKALHDIIAHKIDNRIKYAASDDDVKKLHAEKEDQIFKDANLSPRSRKTLKSTRNGRNKGQSDTTLPSRVQPKRM